MFPLSLQSVLSGRTSNVMTMLVGQFAWAFTMQDLGTKPPSMAVLTDHCSWTLVNTSVPRTMVFSRFA